ncbi:hypothetical protein DN824_14040 [Stutzerimonas nosocomialis]|nr:hypothetical protein DN824_14040 [Stutzerimonas nosocomialis]
MRSELGNCWASSPYTRWHLITMLRAERMTPARYRIIHRAILAQMVGIALLAKGMFYRHW